SARPFRCRTGPARGPGQCGEDERHAYVAHYDLRSKLQDSGFPGDRRDRAHSSRAALRGQRCDIPLASPGANDYSPAQRKRVWRRSSSTNQGVSMNICWRIRVAAVLLVFGLASVAGAQTQITTGVVQGTVVDPSGAVVPGAEVEAKNLGTNAHRTLTTGD